MGWTTRASATSSTQRPLANLDRDLPALLRESRKQGFTTSIISNGYGIEALLDSSADDLDWIGLSVDSADEEVQARLGRGRGRGDHVERCSELAPLIVDAGIKLKIKINTVVNRLTWEEDMRPQIYTLHPHRWRVFQVLPVRGQATIMRGFWLGDTPVTQAMWGAVVGENPSGFIGDAQRPVERADWDDCQAFCDALNEHVSELGIRLPTTVEWEYACRAGTVAEHYCDELEVCGAQASSSLIAGANATTGRWARFAR